MMNTKIMIGVIGALLLITACMPQGPFVLKDDREKRHSLSVTGDSSLEFAPDQAELWFSFLSKAETAKTAQTQNADRSNRVIQALKDAGVASDKIETTNYNVYPEYSWNPTTGKQEFAGYTGTHTLKVTITDVARAGELLDLGVKNGADSVQNVQFSLSKDAEKQAQTKLLRLASSRAKEKAEAITQGMSLSLGKIQSITESNIYNPRPYMYNTYPMMAEGMAKSAPDVQPQKVSMNAHVDVVYELG